MFEFVPVVLKNIFHKPATRNYPTVKRTPCPGQKGHIDIDVPACIYCGMCARKCPVGAIEVSRQNKTWSIDRFQCIVCGACVESCPKKCLSMGREPAAAAAKKSVEVFTPAKETQPAAPAPVKVAVGSEEHQSA